MTFRLLSVLAVMLATLFGFGTVVHAKPETPWFKEAFHTGSYNLGIIQDSDGFIWITTTGGLIRYDGYEQFAFTEGPNGLTSNFVPSVFEDSQKLLWIVTLSGIDLYDKTSGTIRHFQPAKNNPNSIGSNSFNWAPQLVTEDMQGNIWLGSREGIHRFDRENERFDELKHDPDTPGSLISNDVWSILADRQGNILIGTDKGLDVYTIEQQSFTHYIHNPVRTDSIGRGIVYALYQDDNDRIWIGTSEGGLNEFNPVTGSFASYTHDPNDSTSIADDEVFSICEDKSGNLWLGRSFSKSVGLERFNKRNQQFQIFKSNPGAKGSLSGDIIVNCLAGKNGILWVVENTGAVIMWDPFSHRFDLYVNNPEKPETKGLSGLTSVYEDSRGDIWLGGQRGLSRFIEQNGGENDHWQFFPADPNNPEALWNSYAFSVFEDSSGDFWVATDDGYLNLFDRDKGEVLRRYRNPFAKSTARQIVEDPGRPGVLWFGVQGQGLFSFNKKTGEYRQFRTDPNQPNGLKNDYIYTLLFDEERILWVQSQGGLHRFDPQTELFTSYQYDPSNPTSISSNVVNDIYIDTKNVYWVSTDRGLNRFNPKTGKFTSFNEDHGFTTMTIRAILEDDDGDLWLGSNEGIFVFNTEQEKVAFHYTKEDGLQDDSFSLYGSSALKSKSGKLWFAGLNGVNRFSPREIHHNTNPPSVYFLKLSQGGDDLVPRLKTTTAEAIDLDWRENNFEFEFVGLNYSQSHKNQYKYKLEGWDSDWYFAGTKRFGRYSGISGGTYLLKVMAANNDGIWSTRPTALTVYVESPIWQTWWFILFCLLLFVSFVSFFYINRIRQLKRFNTELKKAYLDVNIAEIKYRSIFENAVEGIFQMTQEGHLLNVNPAAAAIMGFDGPEDMLGTIHKVQDWMRISRRQWYSLVTKLRRYGSLSDFEIQVSTKNGTLIWLSVNIRVILDTDGAIDYIDGIAEDITERKKAEEQIWLYQEHLEQLVGERTKEYQDITVNLQKEIRERERVEEELLQSKKLESIGVLAGGIAHDFNNLMTVIMGNINLVQMRAGKDTFEELNKAVQALQRARNLTDKFITFSSGGDPVLKIVDIEEVTRSVVDLALSGTNIQADISVSPGTHFVNIDQSQISQAMHNILENSCNAMVQGGKITIVISRLMKNDTASPISSMVLEEDDYVVVEFQDRGVGIPSEYLSQVFDPYFTTAEMGEAKGKGLGLTISYSIIKKHGGYLFVNSLLGEGTKVRLLLPLAKEKQEIDLQNRENEEISKTEKTVLIMDDEEMLLEMASLMLDNLGYQTSRAPDGDTAIAMYKEALEKGKRYDAVILDLTIPGGVGGREVIKVLQKLDPEVKAVVSSGYANDPVVAEHKQFGFVDALSKPYDMEDLENMLKRVIG